MFIGRETENRFLENYYKKNENQIVVVYGQKGIGKTSLLLNFAQRKDYIYYNCRSCSEREQLYQFGRELKEAGYEVTNDYPDINKICESIFQNHNDSSKKVIIIDEFHYWVKQSPNFISHTLKAIGNKPVLLILSTSASGWVENSMVKKMGANALSINGLLKIRELKFKDICKIYSDFNSDDSINNYSVLGGIPGLWKCFSPQLSFEENIIENVLSPESKLFNEMNIYLSEELREPAVYSTILAALARGFNKLNDIYKHTGFSRAKISVYLKNLMELDVVEKVYSYESAGYADTQKGVYRITNPYVRFYFRFIYPNMSKLQTLISKEFFDTYIADAMDLYVDTSYIKICREILAEKNISVSEWLGKNGAIDIVAKDSKGQLSVASCSFSRQMKLEDYDWLKFCAEKAKIDASKYIIFCEKGFSLDLQKISTEANIDLLTI